MNGLATPEGLKVGRLNKLGALILLIGIIFIGRLFYRQVIERAQFVALAEKQYYTEINQPAQRGQIFIRDRDSQNLVDQKQDGLFPVASNLELFNVVIVPRHVKDKRAAAQKLASLIDMGEEDIYNAINNDRLYISPLKKRLSKEVADKIDALQVTGISTEGQYYRFYPENTFLSHALGFVDAEGSGRYGLEEYYDGLLKGDGGVLKGVKDNMGKIVEVQQSEPGKAGADIALTIDRSIQYMAEQKLKNGIEKYGADGGSLLVMDPKTGGILAMASDPSYDPNKFNEVKTEDQSIFLNPATSLNWEPGSIFKPIIVAAALGDKKVDPDSKPTEIAGGFNNFVTVDGYEIHNSLDKSFGYESVTEILQNSDNVGMVWIANKMSNETILDYIRKFGFLDKTGIDVAGEASGQVGPVKQWRDVNRATISFGQGISATPIQIMQAYAAIANGGNLVKPHLLDKVIDSSGAVQLVKTEEEGQVVSKEDIDKLKEMLVNVVVNGHGKLAQVSGFRVAGKTGTAQIPQSGGGYEDGVSIGSFAGYAPADDPRFVMLVKLNRPKNVEWAESSAAPVFGEMADWLLNSYFKVPKSNQ
jgi:cell division protein FtsI/penicillin-binding protein 2